MRKRANLKHLTPEEKLERKKLRRRQLPIEAKVARAKQQKAWYMANRDEQCLKAKKKYHERKHIERNSTSGGQ